jgi:SAM-dependent methyltransferase
MTECRVCSSTSLEPILDLGEQALTGYFPSKGQKIPKERLLLSWCTSCGLSQLGTEIDIDRLYGPHYGYRTSLNDSMIAHIVSIVHGIEDNYITDQKSLNIMDIGSNDGTLLSCYRGQNLLVGVDPLATHYEDRYPPGSVCIEGFFSEELVRKHTDGIQFDVITAIAMFYDLPEPIEFVHQVKRMLKPNGIWVFEVAYMPHTVSALSYDTICHEHLEYYTFNNLQQILSRAGMKVIDWGINDTNGGSICIAAAIDHPNSHYKTAEIDRLLQSEANAGFLGREVLDDFAERAQAHSRDVRRLLQRIRKRGESVLGIGASTKGNVLLQYAGITPTLLPAIGEVNADKFGKRTPGTNIPIVSEKDILDANPDYLFILPWHFRLGFQKIFKDFTDGGGKLIFPLPRIDIHG